MKMKKEKSGPGPRDYKPSEIKRLFALSKNQCTKPNCKNKLVAEDGKTLISYICHIEAAKKGGPRFNREMDDDQRRSYDNLILLCDEHHRIVDNKENEKEFTKVLLQQWKSDHHAQQEESFDLITDDSIHQFIIKVREIYDKLDSLDGPFVPVVSNNYVDRNIELELIERLKEDKILLLTGVSFCGKSELAKKVARYFFLEESYQFKRVSEVRAASLFLESTGNKRLCILEDPFGHTIANQESSSLKLIRDLLGNISENNLVIITSRVEIVYSIFNESDLSKCTIGGVDWYNLYIHDTEFLEKFWRKIQQEEQLLEQNFLNVLNLIKNDKPIQIGQLNHLSNEKELKFKNFSELELFNMAQIDIDEISNEFIKRGGYTWKILVILSLGCNTIDGLSTKDLDYIFQEKQDFLSIEQKDEDLVQSFLDKDKKPFIFPSYSDKYGNTNTIEKELDLLWGYGYLKCIDNKYFFSHPHYREIGITILRKISTIKQNGILIHIFNVLTSLNIDSAFRCAKNLDLIYNFMDDVHKVKVLDFAHKLASECIFPKVIDQCFLFLMKNYNNSLLGKDVRENIIFNLQSKAEYYGVIFSNGIPVKWSKATFYDRESAYPDEESFSYVIERLRNNMTLGTDILWKGLMSMNGSIIEVNIEFLEYAFKRDEVFIRNLCAYIYFCNLNTFQNSFLKDKILDDEHPSVIFYALKGFFQGLTNNGKSLNKEIADRFLYFFKTNEIFCIRSSNLMSNFSTDYAEDSIRWKEIEKNKRPWLWKLWGDYFPHFLNVFPSSIKFSHTPRFSGMMHEAQRHIYPEQAVRISKKMLQRIIERSKGKILDNWEMSLIDFLIVSTSKHSHYRKNIFKRFFDLKLPTYFIGYNICWALSRWNSLTESEKTVILDTLVIDNESRWLKAIVLNSDDKLAPEIQQAILGKGLSMDTDLEELIKALSDNFLKDIIHVFEGGNWAMDEISISGRSQWVKNIVYYIAENNIDLDYDRCVIIFLWRSINGLNEEEFQEFKRTWVNMYQNALDKDRLLNIVIRTVGNSSFSFRATEFLFKTIIEFHAKESSTIFLAKKLSDNYEALTFYSSDGDIFRVLGFNGFFENEFFQAMYDQFLILSYLSTIKKNLITQEEKEELIIAVKEESEKQDIKFKRAFILIKDISDNNLLRDDLSEILNSIPNNISKKQKQYFQEEDNNKFLDDFKYYYES
tara:strand:- start:148199 stop:151792 length:3594 start_codon:yes stop_codon:yes gene_type:complete